ncbi:iron-siderophore ABC transporter substrate-binding protein [Fulvimarina sp. MAC8]
MIAFIFNLLIVGAAWSACDGREIKKAVQDAPVCIPADPQRIVVLDPLLTIGMMQEMDVPVAGVSFLGIQDDDLRKAVEDSGTVDLGHPAEPSLERIVALKPDLIIGAAYLNLPIYEKISTLAPTVLIDTLDWKEHYRVLADMVGKSEVAETSLQTYEERAAQLKEKLPDTTVSVLRIAPGRFQVYLDSPVAYAPYAVLQDVGIKRSDYETTPKEEVVKRPTWEELSQLDGDILFYVVVSGYEQGPDDALEEETLANPLWQTLPAVKAGHAYRVGRPTWMGFHGVESAFRVLDDVEEYVLNAQ